MTIKPTSYGSWKSPITTDLIVSDSVSLGQIELDGDDIYWVEMRPQEAARNVVVRRTLDGKTKDITPEPFNVRTRVHEYGGACFTVSKGVLLFSNFSDQRLYRQDPGDEPRPLTPAVNLRYGDGVIDPARNLIYCVREDHTANDREAINTLVMLDIDKGGEGTIIASGNDFYSSPALSNDGSRLAWLTWNHPHMPWDGTELWSANVDVDGTLTDARMVTGGNDDAIFQPEWSPDGTLYFVSDRTGWWNLYRLRNGEPEHIFESETEFAAPQWALGTRTYAFESSNRIICQYVKQGLWHIGAFNTNTLQLETIETPYTEMGRGDIKASPGRVVFEAGSSATPTAIIQLDPVSRNLTIVKKSGAINVDKGYLSSPEPIKFPTTNNLTAYAFYYPVVNKDHLGPNHEKPPLLVVSHGGPTGAAGTSFNMSYQFWTSRGIAVLDVNYGGSTGYGTEYRRKLNGNWGIVDIDDCVNGAKYLINRGDVDGERLIIRGGSAGGYTTLAALTFRDVFKVGASYYGVSDLEGLATETHKFESRYMDSMIGPYPERIDLYTERSPIHHTELLSCPIILLQGLEDKIVLPNQAEVMVDALKQKGLPVAYIPFDGEQHGFRKSDNIKRALEAELYFYSRMLNFDVADPIEPVEIINF